MPGCGAIPRSSTRPALSRVSANPSRLPFSRSHRLVIDAHIPPTSGTYAAHERTDICRPRTARLAVDPPDLRHGHTTACPVLGQDGTQVLHALFLRRVCTLPAASHDSGKVVFGACRARGGIGRFVADNCFHEHRIHSILPRGITNRRAKIAHHIGYGDHAPQHDCCHYCQDPPHGSMLPHSACYVKFLHNVFMIRVFHHEFTFGYKLVHS